MSNATALSATSSSQQVVLAGTTTIPGDSVGGTQSKVGSVTALFGWSLSESTGSAGAKVAIWDGTGTGAGNYCRAVIDLASGGTSQHEATPPIQILNNGIYLQVVSGSVDGEIEWG